MNGKNTGFDTIDENIKGIPSDDFSVLETDNQRSGLVFLIRYIQAGLSQGETCMLITHLPIHYLIENTHELGIDISSFIESKKLIILNYKSNIKTEISLTADFDEIFKEMLRLSQTDNIDRIAIQQFDFLMNMSSIFLINNFAMKFATMCRTHLTRNTSVLCQFQNFNDEYHINLSISLQKIASGYYKLNQKDEVSANQVIFKVLKQPWFSYNTSPLQINLLEKNKNLDLGKKVA